VSPWGDLATADARARGLALHLVGRAELEELAGADFAALAEALSRRLGEPPGAPPTAATIDSMARHAAARLLRRLSRWPGSHPALEIFEADQDRRALRAMLRGAVQAAPQEQRMAGLLPTTCLPERALSELARQATPRQVVAHLVALRHPDAARLLPLVAQAEPSLFDVDLALVRGFAARATRAAANGDPNLRAFVRRRIDLCNAELALALAAGPREIDPLRCVVEGGSSTVAPLRREPGETPARLERAGLLDELSIQRRQMRVDPLGSAPLLSFLLRLEAQTVDVCRLTWGAALGAPATVLVPELVTPCN